MHFPRVFEDFAYFQGDAASSIGTDGHAISIAMGYTRADSNRVSVAESGMGAHVDSKRQAGGIAHAR